MRANYTPNNIMCINRIINPVTNRFTAVEGAERVLDVGGLFGELIGKIVQTKPQLLTT